MIKQILAWTVAGPFLLGAFVVLAPIVLLGWGVFWALNTIKVPNDWVN